MRHHRFGTTAGIASFLALTFVVAVPAPAQETPAAGVQPGAAQAQAGGATFTLGVGIGQVEGTAFERVYAPSLRDFKVSELKWDLDNVVMAGVRGTAAFGGRFRASLGYWSAVSEGDGEMVDRDWLLRDSDADAEWTHESRHPDTTVDSGDVLDVALDVRAYAAGAFSVRGILGYKREEWEWSARGGSYVYSWDWNRDGYITADEYRTDRGAFPDGELLVTYRQRYEVPYLGIGCEGAWGPVQVQGRLLYSPWVSAEDEDHHYRGARLYEGSFSGGDWFGAGFSASWFFVPRWYASASVEYQKYAELVGDVTETSPAGRYVYGDSGGMELETVLLQLGAGFRF